MQQGGSGIGKGSEHRPGGSVGNSTSSGILVVLADLGPVQDKEDVGKEARTICLVLQVISMLPHTNCQHGGSDSCTRGFGQSCLQGVVLVGVVVILRPLSVAISQAQPEPKTLVPAAVSCVFIAVKLPKAALMAPLSLSLATESNIAWAVPAGARCLKKRA